MTRSLEEQIAQLALDYVVEPPQDPNDVINYASPEELLSAFAAASPIELADVLPAESDEALVAATELVIKHSVHTTHPRFLNQNFAGPYL